ncbi:MAG: helix-turn-helix transcriptional regulator [Chitinophagaceae bacterium]|nr:helix-turn-helix transcriptional regulator [Chitinophagaceae bacterium]
MTYYTISPSALLSGFVRCFWALESTDQTYTHRSMADVCAEMVFHYNGRFDELLGGKSEPSCISALQGPLTQIRRFRIDKPFAMFGVYLYPYSIPVLFGIPATEISNQMPDLITLLGKEGEALEEKMILAFNNKERVKIITEFLEKRIQKNQQRNHAVFSSIRFIIQTKGTNRIEKVADQYFISQRQFERKFREFSGLAPKLFSRIVRFHSACQLFGDSNKSLTSIAYDCGYYDQSHFIHDFKEFSGYHPRHYFSGKAEGTEWKTE